MKKRTKKGWKSFKLILLGIMLLGMFCLCGCGDDNKDAFDNQKKTANALNAEAKALMEELVKRGHAESKDYKELESTVAYFVDLYNCYDGSKYIYTEQSFSDDLNNYRNKINTLKKEYGITDLIIHGNDTGAQAMQVFNSLPVEAQTLLVRDVAQIAAQGEGDNNQMAIEVFKQNDNYKFLKAYTFKYNGQEYNGYVAVGGVIVCEDAAGNLVLLDRDTELDKQPGRRIDVRSDEHKMSSYSDKFKAVDEVQVNIEKDGLEAAIWKSIYYLSAQNMQNTSTDIGTGAIPLLNFEPYCIMIGDTEHFYLPFSADGDPENIQDDYKEATVSDDVTQDITFTGDINMIHINNDGTTTVTGNVKTIYLHDGKLVIAEGADVGNIVKSPDGEVIDKGGIIGAITDADKTVETESLFSLYGNITGSEYDRLILGNNICGDCKHTMGSDPINDCECSCHEIRVDLGGGDFFTDGNADVNASGGGLSDTQ